MKMKCLLPTMLLLFFGTACVSLNSVSISPVPADRSRQVFAEASSMAFLGVAFSNTFIDNLTADLASQCPNGSVKGILTYFENTIYFIMVERRVQATGYCVVDSPTDNSLPSENETNL